MVNVSISRLNFHLGYHYELINHPPQKVNYYFKNRIKGIPIEAVFNGSKNWKRFIQPARAIKNYDYSPYFSNPKQLIHSSGMPIVNTVSHVIDTDMFFYPYLVDMFELERIKGLKVGWPLVDKLNTKIKSRLAIAKKLLKSKFCKKILPWSKWCKDYIMDFIDDPEINDKIELLYPAVNNVNCKKESNKNIRLLYSGGTGSFRRKGGVEMLQVFEKLRANYKNIELIYIGDIPEYIPYIFNKYGRCEDIKFYRFLPKTALFELYRKSDIFVLPTKHETFLISLLEAMNFSLPIVTTKGKFFPVSKEIVDDGVSGFLIELKDTNDPDNIAGTIDFDDFVKKLSLLIEDRGLRESMGRAGKNNIVDGKFSIKKRNKRLQEIYEEALQ